MTKKAFVSTLAILAIAFAAPAFANALVKKPKDYRRTTTVHVAQKTLHLEVPKGMCFLDRSLVNEEAIYNAFRSTAEAKQHQVLIGVFSDCDKIANMGGDNGLNDLPLNAGMITWLNPSIGETTALERDEYLDMREAGLQDYAREHAGDLKVAKKVHRGPYSVSAGMTGSIKLDGATKNSVAVISTTTIRHIPLEITLRYTGKDAPTLDKLYPLVDKLVAQQIVLNE